MEGESLSILESDETETEASVEEVDSVILPGIAFDLDGSWLGRKKDFITGIISKQNYQNWDLLRYSTNWQSSNGQP